MDILITRACNEALNFVRDESRFISPYMALQDISDTILALVRQSIAAFARRQNERALVLTMLPSEILGLICQHLSLRNCIAVTHVCQRLRYMLISGNPLLWNDIRFWDDGGRLTTLLGRSASGDVELTGSITSQNWSEVACCLRNHLYRCTSLRLNLPGVLPAEGREAITRALCSPAPRLRKFQLLDPLQQFNPNFDAKNALLSGDAPNLKLLKLHANIQSVIVPPSTGFSNLKRLFFSPANFGASMVDIIAVLERFPDLKALSIEWDDWLDDVQPEVTLPDTLKIFSLISANGRQADPAQVLARVRQGDSPRFVAISHNRFPSFETVQAIINWRPPVGETVTTLVLYTILTASSVDLFSTNLLEHSTGPLSTPVAVGDSPFANLVIFSICEDLFQCALPLPRAPVLTILLILVRRPVSSEDPRADQSIFLLPRNGPGGARFECPSLRQLCFNAPSDLPPLSVDPALVREFVGDQLLLNTDAPPTLLLKGVRLLENIPEEIAKLLALVETVMEGSPFEDATVISGSHPDEAWSASDLRHWG